MKLHTALFCSLLFAGSLTVAGQQTSPTQPGGTPPYQTPPTFPQDQTTSPQSRPTGRPEPTMPPDQSAPGANSSTSVGQSTDVRVKGCLTQVGQGFSITDRSTGTIYQLQGNRKDLAGYADQEVSIRGAASEASATSTSGTEQSSSLSRVLNVTSVKKIADRCKTQPK